MLNLPCSLAGIGNTVSSKSSLNSQTQFSWPSRASLSSRHCFTCLPVTLHNVIHGGGWDIEHMGDLDLRVNVSQVFLDDSLTYILRNFHVDNVVRTYYDMLYIGTLLYTHT